METIWKVLSCFAALLLSELCNGLPLDLDHTYADGHTQFLTGLIAVLLTICGIVCLAGCLCCQRRNGFKEFRDSPIVVSVASNLDHGHVNPIANGGGNGGGSAGEFTIFTPLSPPHHNNNVFLANQQVVTRAEEDYKNEGEISSWFGPNEKDFPRTRLKYIRELGKGWFGRVVEGTAQGLDEDDSAWTPVVVRILESTASSRQRVLFLHDATIYRCPQHPNVLKLLGRSLETVPLLLLQEHCTQGDLKLYLKQQQLAKETFLSSDLPLLWCYQLTSALKHLHSYNITHPDLSTRNCQLTFELTLKLGDYGCSMSDYPEDYYHGTENVPIRWCAPECVTFTATTIQTKNVTLPGNIWSLGVCFWEVFECGGQPYSLLTDDEVVSQVLGSPNIRLGKPSVSVLYTDYVYRLMQLCWSSHESRPSVLQIDAMLADLMQVHENTKVEPSVSMQDFDVRWENLKPNAIVKTDNHGEPENDLTNITVLNMNMGDGSDGKRLSASLHNLAGSFDNLLDSTRNDMDSWLENVNDDVSFAKGLSEAMHDLDSAIAAENISSSDSETGGNAKLKFKLGPLPSSESETEDETWRRRIERGAYTEKVRQKSRSVADLMVLTHIDCSESDSETPLPSLGYRNVRYGPRQNLENAGPTFGSEGNLLNVQDTFQEELKKLQEERRDSLLFVPDNVKESRSAKRLLDDLNSTATIEPPKNQVFNVYNVTISPKYSPIHAADLNRLINFKEKEEEGRNVLPDLVLNTMESKRDIPKLSEIIENNIELMDYIITKYDSNPDLESTESSNSKNLQEELVVLDKFQNHTSLQVSKVLDGNISLGCDVDNHTISEGNTIYQKNLTNNLKLEKNTFPNEILPKLNHIDTKSNGYLEPIDKISKIFNVNGIDKEENFDHYKCNDLQNCNNLCESTNVAVDTLQKINHKTENFSNGVGEELDVNELECTNDADHKNFNDPVAEIKLDTIVQSELSNANLAGVEQTTCAGNEADLIKTCSSDVEENCASVEVKKSVLNGGSTATDIQSETYAEIRQITKSESQTNGIEINTLYRLDSTFVEPVKETNLAESVTSVTEKEALETIDNKCLLQLDEDKNGTFVLSTPALVNNSELLSTAVVEAVNESLIGLHQKPETLAVDFVASGLEVTNISKDHEEDSNVSCTKEGERESTLVVEAINKSLFGLNQKPETFAVQTDSVNVASGLEVTTISKDHEEDSNVSCTKEDGRESNLNPCGAPKREEADLLFYSLTDNNKQLSRSDFTIKAIDVNSCEDTKSEDASFYSLTENNEKIGNGDITVDAINVNLCEETKSEDAELSFSSLSDNIQGGSECIVEAVNVNLYDEPKSELVFSSLSDNNHQLGENDSPVEAKNYICFEKHSLNTIKNAEPVNCDLSTHNLKENIVHETLVDDLPAQIVNQFSDIGVDRSQTNNTHETKRKANLVDSDIMEDILVDTLELDCAITEDDIDLILMDENNAHPNLTNKDPITSNLKYNNLAVDNDNSISQTSSFLLAEKYHNDKAFNVNAVSNIEGQDRLCNTITKELRVSADDRVNKTVKEKEAIHLEDIVVHINNEYDQVEENKGNDIIIEVKCDNPEITKEPRIGADDRTNKTEEDQGPIHLEDVAIHINSKRNDDVLKIQSNIASILEDKVVKVKEEHKSVEMEITNATSESENCTVNNLKNLEEYNDKSQLNSVDSVDKVHNQIYIEVVQPSQNAYLIDEKNRINSSGELTENILKVMKREHVLGSMEDFTGIIDLITDGDKVKPLLAEVDSGFVTSCDAVEEMGRSLDESVDISSEAPVNHKLLSNGSEVDIMEIVEDSKPNEAPVNPKLLSNDIDNFDDIVEDSKPLTDNTELSKTDGSLLSTNMLLVDVNKSSDNNQVTTLLLNVEASVENRTDSKAELHKTDSSLDSSGKSNDATHSNQVENMLLVDVNKSSDNDPISTLLPNVEASVENTTDSKVELHKTDSSRKSNDLTNSNRVKNMSNLSSNLNNQISISGDESAVHPQSLIVKTQDFINNEILRYEDGSTSQKLAFDLNSTEEDPNPIFRPKQESSVILGASDDYSIDFYTGLKTTNGEAANGDMRYSLETWDNFLGKSFDEYSAQPQSLIFLDEEKREPHEISTTFILNSPAERNEDPNTTFVIDEANTTFTVEGENDAVDVNDISVELEDTNTKPEEGYDNPGYWENDNSSGWFLHPQTNNEEVSGQMDIAQDDSYVGFSMDDEIMAAIRNELLMKLPQAQRASSEHVDDGEEYQTERNEVIVRYNCYNTPLSPIPEESYSELLHSGQSTPHCTINTDMADGDSDWSEPGIDPNSIQDDDTHSPRVMDSPQKSVLNRHTPSQDSCCSNDTLFNLEELDRNIELGDLKCTLTKMDEDSFDESEEVPLTKEEIDQQIIDESLLPPSPNTDCSEQTKLADNTTVRDKPTHNDESQPNVEVVNQIVITECGAPNVVESLQKEESSSSSETYLTVSDGYAPPNVAPLNSPEDRPWKHIEASLTACEDTTPKQFSTDAPAAAAPCDNDDGTLSSNSEEEYANEYENIEEMNLKNALATMKAADYVNLNENIYDCIDERTNLDYVNLNEQQVKNDVHDYVNSSTAEVKTILYENLDHENYLDLLDDDIEVEYDSRGSVEDVFGPLTDIRFTGPSDSQMMTTSFSDSNDLGDEQDWDSGSDTRSSSSGEFIWKEGEHEASVKALHAAPQDEETHQMEDNQDEESSSSSEEDGDGPEFVPSAWDKYATPTKSALRSPEKTLDRPAKKTRGVSFKKQKYHCVYEYPREPDSPVVQSFDLWQDPQHVIDWDLDRDTEPFLPATAVSDIETLNDTDANTQKNSRQQRNLYQISSVPDFIGSSIIDDDFYISSSAKPFDVFGGAPSSQFFPGRHCDWSDLIKNNDNVTPDSGVEDITPGSLSDSSDYVRPNRQILPLKTLAQLAINKGSGTGSNEIGGLRHTRNRLKLDLPPSPSAFTKTFTIEPINDPVVSRQVPTFTTFGKSRFVVQHVDTPEGKVNALNVSFEALPYKPIVDKHRIESVRGEASLLDSADEDSGIESCTLERKSS